MTVPDPYPDCMTRRGPCETRRGIVTTNPDPATLTPESAHFAANCCGNQRCVIRLRRASYRATLLEAQFVPDDPGTS